MAFFSQRRHRPAKKSSSPSQQPRRRLDVSSGGGDLEFPVSAVGCNSFLMGGQFYPGKDKKRRQMRRRTLWYKIFCSSTWRQAVSALVLCYVLVWRVILPATDWLLKIGQTLSSHPHRTADNEWILTPNDESLLIPTIKEQIGDADRLNSERTRLRRVGQEDEKSRFSQRMKMIQDIVPKWYEYRKFIPNKTNTDGTKTKDTKDAKPAIQADEKHEKGKVTPSNNQVKDIKRIIEDGKKDESLARALDQAEREGNELTNGLHQTNSAHVHKSDLIDVSGGRPKVETIKSAEDIYIRTLHDTEPHHGSKCSPNMADDDLHTTLVLQTSVDRLWIVNETCLRWKDPIVVVVFLPTSSTNGAQTVDEFVESSQCSNAIIIKYMASEDESKLDRYPVNRLRNVALDAVSTSHILVVDVDFVPSQDLHETVRAAISDLDAVRNALVVPAFERALAEPCASADDCASHLREDGAFLPRTFEDLNECVDAEGCTVFQRKFNWEGHFSTRSEDWLRRKWYSGEGDDKKLKYVKCFHTPRYEPYVVLRWCPAMADPAHPVAPYYDERFHGYGKNKIELVSQLRALGYRFPVLPEGFIVHNPHPESSVKETWNDKQGNSLHGNMDKLYNKFLKELAEKYKDVQDTVGICDPPAASKGR